MNPYHTMKVAIPSNFRRIRFQNQRSEGIKNNNKSKILPEEKLIQRVTSSFIRIFSKVDMQKLQIKANQLTRAGVEATITKVFRDKCMHLSRQNVLITSFFGSNLSFLSTVKALLDVSISLLYTSTVALRRQIQQLILVLRIIQLQLRN